MIPLKKFILQALSRTDVAELPCSGFLVGPFLWHMPLSTDIIIPSIHHMLPGSDLSSRTLFGTFSFLSK